MVGLLIFGAVLAGFIFVMRRPEWTGPYFAFILFMRISDSIRGEYGLPSLFMALAPGLLLLAIGRWLFFGSEVGRGWRPALWLLFAYGSVCAGSLLYAGQTELTREALMNYADGILIALIVTLYVRNMVDFERVVWALIVATFILASLSVWQQLTGGYEDTFAGFARVELRNIHDATRGFRSEGPVSANYFGMILVAAVPLAAERMLHALDRRARAFAAVTLAVALLAIVFTYSRGAIVALAVVSVMMLVSWVPRRVLGRAIVVGALPAVIAIAFLLPAEYTQRLAALGQVTQVSSGSSIQDRAIRGRLSEVTSAIMMFGDHPLIGVGYGNFEAHYPRYAQMVGLDGRREQREAHSLYLEVAAETGLVGIVVFGTLVGFACLTVRSRRRSFLEEGNRAAAHLLTGFGISLLGYLVGSIFLHLTYPRYFWLMIGLAIATWPFAPASRVATSPMGAPATLAPEGA